MEGRRKFDSIYSKNSCGKVLGYIWENNRGIKKLSLPEIDLNPDQVITKILMLGMIGRLYDPIGLINQFIVTSKILMQDCWKTGLEWDKLRLRCWCEDFIYLREFEIDRHYFGKSNDADISDTQTHRFTDSSVKAHVIHTRQ
ncbi:hypothetical protein AVEN_68493-1 [Araneus ventricosus]|uniref:Uncharacterized protein n=1 Tax=Araneus ventricosus TaxID=182803 RepID=A0A4Y2I5R2_ARAVE|nr:hypothetical protein AVEN_68493-1 [Araneus ventricosus]